MLSSGSLRVGRCICAALHAKHTTAPIRCVIVNDYSVGGSAFCSHAAAHDHHASPAGSTLNAREVAKFSRYADGWWDELGEAAPLHALNALRVPLVKNGLLSAAGLYHADASLPLRQFSVVDVGCGGGILAESLARLGARVLGIDACQENVQVAEAHAAASISLSQHGAGVCSPVYRCCTVEQIAAEQSGSYDAVVASEVVEHVDNQALFIDMCCRLLKPGGSLFVTTLNRTRMSWLLAIVGGEHVARVLPRGTHEWRNFVTPTELHAMFSANGLVLRLQHGMRYNPLSGCWSWCEDTSCCYATHAVLPPSSDDTSAT